MDTLGRPEQILARGHLRLHVIERAVGAQMLLFACMPHRYTAQLSQMRKLGLADAFHLISDSSTCLSTALIDGTCLHDIAREMFLALAPDDAVESVQVTTGQQKGGWQEMFTRMGITGQGTVCMIHPKIVHR